MEHRNKKLALVHVAKKELGLSDDAYRVLLVGACGCESAKHIVSDKQFSSVMLAFKNAGWSGADGHGRVGVDCASEYTQANEWGCSTPQRNKIVALWYDRADNRSMVALRAFIKRTTGVSHEWFLSTELASTVIVAIEKL